MDIDYFRNLYYYWLLNNIVLTKEEAKWIKYFYDEENNIEH